MVNGDARPDRGAQLSLGLLRPCLLVHVQNRSAYGYELRGQLAAMGLECDLGTVYRVLNTMEAEGLLRSTWERSSNGRSRRRYELSETGVAMVQSYAETVEHFVTVATAFLRMRNPLQAGADDCDSARDEPPAAEVRGLPTEAFRALERGVDRGRLEAAPPT